MMKHRADVALVEAGFAKSSKSTGHDQRACHLRWASGD